MEAVLFGRFNLITIGHMEYFKNVIKKYEKINIGITTSDSSTNIPKGFDEFYQMSDNQHKRNIFSVQERCMMLRASLISNDLIDYAKIHIIKRPDYFIDEFNRRFPPEKYQLVLPRDKDINERLTFSKILMREIDVIDIRFETHISDVILNNNQLVEVQKATEKYLDKGCLEVFRSLDGLQRILSKL